MHAERFVLSFGVMKKTTEEEEDEADADHVTGPSAMNVDCHVLRKTNRIWPVSQDHVDEGEHEHDTIRHLGTHARGSAHQPHHLPSFLRNTNSHQHLHLHHIAHQRTNCATLGMGAPDVLPPPPKSCLICTEEPQDDQELIMPCRVCRAWYCPDCLGGMFTAAVDDDSRMPPRCCALLQLHTAISALTEQETNDYRAKFEEWSTVNKTYCPSPTCSAFIPDRLLPVAIKAGAVPTLQAVLGNVVEQVSKSALARFFRGELDVTQQPGYTTVVARPIDLSKITDRLNAGQYRSAADLTRDMALIAENASTYNGPTHPVAKTANDLFDLYLHHFSSAMDGLLDKPGEQRAQTMFACSKCHMGICASCKQIEHGTKACDTSAANQETAMLETFGYKRCPLCRHAVRKMFGCSHIQCLCGAHWCYYCCRAIDQCDGACDPRMDEDSDIEEDDDFDENDEADPPVGPVNPEQPERERIVSTVDHSGSKPAINPSLSHATGNAPIVPENLDAGGARRWADTEMDFGSEPEDELWVLVDTDTTTKDDRLTECRRYTQIWSCKHRFQPYELPNDDCNHGDLSRMECNICFEKVTAKLSVRLATTRPTPRQKRRPFAALHVQDGSDLLDPKDSVASDTIGEERETQALECRLCRFVVCRRCRQKKYPAAKTQ